MTAYRRQQARFDAHGLRLLALSVDTPAASAKLRRELDLPFTLLCDPERAMVTAWSLLNRGERDGIAFPATFVLARGGVIVFRSLDRLVSRVSPEPVLAFVDDWARDPSRRGENTETSLQVPGPKDAALALVRKWFGER